MNTEEDKGRKRTT